MAVEPCKDCGKWCEPHALTKSEEMRALCKIDESQRRAWEMTAEERRKELAGTYIASLLQSVGITKENYARAKQAIGLPPGCSCEEREAWLNKAHALAKEWSG